MVTAGPTHEPIDPVRFIANHSSGKMGYAIAEVLAEKGSNVILISGPVKLKLNPHPNIQLIKVQTAMEMLDQCVSFFPGADGAILSAAVADYRPKHHSQVKMKSSEKALLLELEPTADIAALLGKTKTNKQFLVGFALETNNELTNAREKLVKKNFDFIVLNSLNDEGAGFSADTNKITIIGSHNNMKEYELKSKRDVALDIINHLSDILK